jgi:hypothetical protein
VGRYPPSGAAKHDRQIAQITRTQNFCGATITIASVESHVRAAHKMKPRKP